jgi:ankyrin repeat protein
MGGTLGKISRIEIYSCWCGFADPPSVTAKLTIEANAERFLREVAIDGPRDELQAECVQQFLVELERPVLSELTPTVFDQPFEAVSQHYNSITTDDSPAVLVQVTDRAGTVIQIRSESQHAFMLPLTIFDATHGSVQKTYDPQLSRSIAALMPESFLNRHRLADYGRMFQLDLEWAIRRETCNVTSAADSDRVGTTSEEISPERQFEEHEARLQRLFSREESSEEKAEAERTGDHSQRLLKRIPLDELTALLERGADPNVADDAGQTALMHAAFRPFDRERFERLVQAGANLEVRRTDGFNGLQLACSGGETESAAAWIAAGADVNVSTPHGATPLMLSASWDKIVKLLLAHNATVNAVDQDGHSALAYAVLRQNSVRAKRQLQAIQELLSAGANVSLSDGQGLTPLDHARRVLARVDLSNEVMQAFADSRAAEERRPSQSVRKQQTEWLEQHRRAYPEDESLIKDFLDNRTLASEVLELLDAAVTCR